MTNAIFAQSATEHHIWQEEKTFRPLSTTAVAITGPIKLSGNPKFAVKGSMMSITFGVESLSRSDQKEHHGVLGGTQVWTKRRLRFFASLVTQGNLKMATHCVVIQRESPRDTLSSLKIPCPTRIRRFLVCSYSVPRSRRVTSIVQDYVAHSIMRLIDGEDYGANTTAY
jgi:hypothetical protein